MKKKIFSIILSHYNIQKLLMNPIVFLFLFFVFCCLFFFVPNNEYKQNLKMGSYKLNESNRNLGNVWMKWKYEYMT